MQKIISYTQIGKLAFPMMVAQSAVFISGLIDLAFIGPYGAAAIAAVSIANAICATLFNFFEGFRLGTTVLIAKAAALSDSPKGASVINAGIVLVAAIGLIFIPFAPYISEIVYGIAGDATMKFHGVEYLTVWLRALPFVLMSYLLSGLFRGLGDTATPLYASVVVCFLNGIFDYLFVCGGFGFPRLGVAGAAWGTWLANLVGLAILSYLSLSKPLTRGYMKRLYPSRKQIRDYAVLAADIGLNTGFTLLALLLFVFMVKSLGAGALAAHQITLQVFNVAYLPAVGFLLTASMVVPRLAASRRTDLLIPTVIRICKMSFSVILAASSLTFVFSEAIGGFFSPADKLAADCAAQTIKLVCVGQLFSSVYMVLRGALTGCGDSRFIVYEGWVSGYLIFLPLAYLMAIKLGYGILGGYTAFVLWCMTDCAALAFRLFVQNRYQENLAGETE